MPKSSTAPSQIDGSAARPSSRRSAFRTARQEVRLVASRGRACLDGCDAVAPHVIGFRSAAGMLSMKLAL